MLTVSYEFGNTVAAGTVQDWDLTAKVPGFSLTPNGSCPGYAVCLTGYFGSGDTWEAPYTASDGHAHWNVGSMGSGGGVVAVITAWPVIGTGYSTEPFGCGSACNIQAEYTTAEAVPGQGFVPSSAIPNSAPGSSFSCVFVREGDLGQGAAQGSLGVVYGSSSAFAFASNPTGGDSAFTYVQMLTLYRPTGPFPVTGIAISRHDQSVTVGTNCRMYGLVQDFSNTEGFFVNGSTVQLPAQQVNSFTEAMCLLNQ